MVKKRAGSISKKHEHQKLVSLSSEIGNVLNILEVADSCIVGKLPELRFHIHQDVYGFYGVVDLIQIFLKRLKSLPNCPPSNFKMDMILVKKYLSSMTAIQLISESLKVGFRSWNPNTLKKNNLNLNMFAVVKLDDDGSMHIFNHSDKIIPEDDLEFLISGKIFNFGIIKIDELPGIVYYLSFD